MGLIPQLGMSNTSLVDEPSDLLRGDIDIEPLKRH
jgi:hypothetical protein